MRKVEICEQGSYLPNQEPSELSNGLFHGFFSFGSTEEGIECYAVVELENGVVRDIPTHKVKFLDVPHNHEGVEQSTTGNAGILEIALCIKEISTRISGVTPEFRRHLLDEMDTIIEQHNTKTIKGE